MSVGAIVKAKTNDGKGFRQSSLVELDNTNGTDATVLVQFVWFEV